MKGKKQVFNLYVRDGVAYLPVTARTTAGYYLDVDPVVTLDPPDAASLEAALRRVMTAGNPERPTPSRASFPAPVVLAPAGVKSWGTFVKRAANFSIVLRDAEVEINESGPALDGDWTEGRMDRLACPPEEAARAIAIHVLTRIAARDDIRA
ncbi:hypothetical protein [Mitsuaria sp. GD03876]|uniref:hypothetical protein n=1 Tax=Mitsuaria sp. GD03876 TaxID=2975399 RepID=UPI00244733B6|nr:hypothetical protein [Mitsuaria sp. GD03876]MDH0863147.1 hypothetical protein [Mitsuaria sp. GD03876]